MTECTKQYLAAAEQFCLEGKVLEISPYGEGHINLTLLVETDKKRYIMQKMNTKVFPDPVSLMRNICGVTEHLRARGIETLEVIPTKSGESFIYGEECYRMYAFIENTITYQKVSDAKVFENSGKAFGEFQLYLADYPVGDLNIVIPHFHNTIRRYDAFKEAIARDEQGRAVQVQAEIDGFMQLEEMATKPYRMQKAGILPLRVSPLYG